MLSKEEINFNKARENLFRLLAAVNIIYYDEMKISNASIQKMRVFYKQIKDRLLNRDTVIDIAANNEVNGNLQSIDENPDTTDEKTNDLEEDDENVEIEFSPETYKQWVFNTDYIFDTIPQEVCDLVLNKEGYDYRSDIYEEIQELLERYLEAARQLDLYYEPLMELSPSGNVIKTIRGGPGILEDYRQDSWGIPRICLDGFQNHLPTDSNGTKCYLQFLVDGQWLSRDEALTKKDQITEVRFMDNGVGFTYSNLLYLHSTKTSEDLSAGQFGEGMKLLSIAAVKLGLDLEFQSRNWTANATSEIQTMINTRAGDKAKRLRRLVYDIKVYDGKLIIGSRTIFHHPSKEFIDYALQLPEKILVLGNIKPVYGNENVEIIDFDKGGELFAKGIYLRSKNSFFKYNFLTAKVNPDRNDFINSDYISIIAWLYASTEDSILIKNLLKKMIQYCTDPNNKDNIYWNENLPLEFRIHEKLLESMSFANSSLWKNAFYEVCKELEIIDKDNPDPKIALKTSYVPPASFKKALDDYKLIRFPRTWVDVLKKIGIKTDEEIIPEFIEETLETSLTRDYGDGIWNAERMVLDLCQNHLPSDSGGDQIWIRFLDKYDKWHDYREFEKFSDYKIKRIKIVDNGTGYSYLNLGLFSSGKKSKKSKASGKFGEGAKMAALAGLRNGMRIEFRSMRLKWRAISEFKQETISTGKKTKTVDRLVFRVKELIKSDRIWNDNDNPENGDYGYTRSDETSSTTIYDPTHEVINEFRHIQEKILMLSPRTPLVEENGVQVLATSGRQIFVRQILIPGNHPIRFTYHFPNFDIETRDRNIVSNEALQEKIRALLTKTTNKNFIREFISASAAYSQESSSRKQCLEFETPFSLINRSPQADAWISTFIEMYGDKAGIRDERDDDFDAVHRAQHVGVKLISLPSCVTDALKDLKDSKGQQISSYESLVDEAFKNAVYVKFEDLTPTEQSVVRQLEKYRLLLGENSNNINEIRIFDYPKGYTGFRVAGFAYHFSNYVNISRASINNGILYAGHIFFHEADHAITGTNDADVGFRDYLTKVLSMVAANILPFQQSIDDGGLTTGINMEEFTNAIFDLSRMLGHNKDKGEIHDV